MNEQLREIRLRPQAGRRIVAGKIDSARKMLCQGIRVRFLIPFRFRDSDQVEQRLRLMGRVIVSLQDVSVVEQPPEEETPRLMTLVLKPATP